MKVETLEYGDDPEKEYREDFNSFKVFTVWSEPDVKITDDSVPVKSEDLEEKDSSREAKRLVTAVEFPITVSGYFYVERPNPTPDWLEKIFDLLKEEGWQGHSFRTSGSTAEETSG
ncbi:MAG: hypothetical protein ABEK16_06070 [Candidatus Nanohalobium sp.]